MKASKEMSPPLVCGVDGSDGSRRAFHLGVDLARALGTRLVAVMAWQPSMSMYDANFPAPERAPKVVALGTLEEVVGEEFGGDWPEWVQLRADPGRAGTVLVAAARDAAMLIVGSRGSGELSSPFLGSVSLFCATQAECPVLIVRPIPVAGRRDGSPGTQG